MEVQQPFKGVPLARSVALSPFVSLLELGGVSARPILLKTRIDPEILETPEAFLALQQAAWFVDRAARRAGIDDFGLRTGAATPITSLGVFGEVIGRSYTLRDLIRNLIRWAPSLNSGVEITPQAVSHDSLELRLRERIEDSRQTDEYSFMLLISALRLALGASWRPREVVLSKESRSFASGFEALSEAKIVSETGYVAVRIPRAALDNPLPARLERHSRGLKSFLESTTPSDEFGTTLAKVVGSMLGVNPPSIETAAEIAGVSSRTLQRRLAAAATSFEEIVDRVRFEKALELLRNPSWKAGSVGSRLGYSDAANFSRAFRRWTGSSPADYRKRLWGIG